MAQDEALDPLIERRQGSVGAEWLTQRPGAVERQLVDVLVLEALQMLFAEVVDGCPLGQLAPEEGASGGGEQHLPTVAGRADAGSAHDVDTEISLVADLRLPGVQSHAHAHLVLRGPLVRGERALGGNRGGGRVPRPRKREEEGIALRVDLLAVVGGESLADDAAVRACDLGIAVAECLSRPRSSPRYR